MQSLPYLYYKGVNSLDLSLMIKTKSTHVSAERDKVYVSVPGRNGDLIQDNGRHKNIVLPYTFTVVKSDYRNFADLVQAIKAWLSNDASYYIMWDSYDPRYYRYASVDGNVNITEELLEHIGSFAVNFNCKPYRYSFDGQNTISVPAAGMTIYNPEVLAAKPYIKIYGSGSISLTVNNSTITIADVDGYVELDSETMNAYKGINLLNNKMTGSAFPELVPGDNTIAFTGTVTGAEIVPRWCTK